MQLSVGNFVELIDPHFCGAANIPLGTLARVVALGGPYQSCVTVKLLDRGLFVFVASKHLQLISPPFEDTLVAVPGELVESDKPDFGKHLPTDAAERKSIPIFSGVFQYFPDALVEIAKVSKVGNDQHNGKDSPLHWVRGKSTDQEDTLLRHLLEAGTVDSDGMLHSAKVAWRALSRLQLEIEDRRKNGLPETKAV